jgi:putative copper export protein
VGHSAVPTRVRDHQIGWCWIKGMLPIDINVIRLTVHILAATIWVGGLIVLGALAPAARAFARLGWPAFAVLIATGIWNLVVGSQEGSAYQSTLMAKMGLVVLSGLGAGLHTFTKNPTLKGAWGAVAMLGALGAVLLGVALAQA